ncbi:MAG: polyprenyl synthetase family protein [Syntrophomonadaceae bacterium]|nr:polyprenyl synthetase family protein [Syntrophomonadaceae bacterium]
MREVLRTGNSDIDAIMEYLLEGSGKLLRPRLVYLTSSFYPHDPEMKKDIAVAVELIHLASLIHDDIIDLAMTRRGKDSINKRWGNHCSVLAGDYLFATAFKLINRYGQAEVMNSITHTIQLMCIGEIKQLSMSFDLQCSEADYLDKTYHKTACLFASSCKVGALISSMPDHEAKQIEQFGLCLGYAYQIIDDLLDFVADSSMLGKPVGSDLLEGNVTLPVIYALQSLHYGPILKEILGKPLEQRKLQKVKEILAASQALDYALASSRSFLKQALLNLENLPAGHAAKELKSLAVYLMEGYYKNLNNLNPPPEKEVMEN